MNQLGLDGGSASGMRRLRLLFCERDNTQEPYQRRDLQILSCELRTSCVATPENRYGMSFLLVARLSQARASMSAILLLPLLRVWLLSMCFPV